MLGGGRERGREGGREGGGGEETKTLILAATVHCTVVKLMFHCALLDQGTKNTEVEVSVPTLTV